MTETNIQRKQTSGKYQDRNKTPLTPAQNALAAHAWQYAQKSLRIAQRRNGRHADVISAILANRITIMIRKFNPDLSALNTWANKQVFYATAEAKRREPNDFSTRGNRGSTWRKEPESLSGRKCIDPRGEPAIVNPLDRIIQRDGGAEQRDCAELREYLLAVLPEKHRRFFELYAEGATMKEAGRELGISESRISQIRTNAQALLRERLEQLQA